MAATGFSFNFDRSCVIRFGSKLILIWSCGVREGRSLAIIVRTKGRCDGLGRKGRRRGQQPSRTGVGSAQGGAAPSARPPSTPPLTPLSPPARRIRAPQGRPAPSLPEMAGRTARGLKAHAPPADQPSPFSTETMNNYSQDDKARRLNLPRFRFSISRWFVCMGGWVGRCVWGWVGGWVGVRAFSRTHARFCTLVIHAQNDCRLDRLLLPLSLIFKHSPAHMHYCPHTPAHERPRAHIHAQGTHAHHHVRAYLL